MIERTLVSRILVTNEKVGRTPGKRPLIECAVCADASGIISIARQDGSPDFNICWSLIRCYLMAKRRTCCICMCHLSDSLNPCFYFRYILSVVYLLYGWYSEQLRTTVAACSIWIFKNTRFIMSKIFV